MQIEASIDRIWRGAPLPTESPSTGISIPHKRQLLLCFQLFWCLLFFKNKQLEVILMTKRHILGWPLLPPFTHVRLTAALEKQKVTFSSWAQW